MAVLNEFCFENVRKGWNELDAPGVEVLKICCNLESTGKKFKTSVPGLLLEQMKSREKG